MDSESVGTMEIGYIESLEIEHNIVRKKKRKKKSYFLLKNITSKLRVIFIL
jgi:hypothetical protein